ncbi:hypothetical protein HZY91_10735 [Facklamia sp. DSM 111018]|uniref:Uncharacterized protein n=1 Tax=Facklamia lactis TaxID=2749967 RepID=A0ABS0LT61_9LACT|nr:hypothetical protein [Facklamia lactis]MBG9987341.1 hypothetical protein [Facklamia lactis]
MNKYPNNVHPIDIDEYDNYALIQNFIFLKKEFIGEAFTVNNIHSSIVKEDDQKNIKKKLATQFVFNQT